MSRDERDRLCDPWEETVDSRSCVRRFEKRERGGSTFAPAVEYRQPGEGWGREKRDSNSCGISVCRHQWAPNESHPNRGCEKTDMSQEG